MYLVIKLSRLEVDNNLSPDKYKILSKHCRTEKVAVFEDEDKAHAYAKDRQDLMVIDCKRGGVLKGASLRLWEEA